MKQLFFHLCLLLAGALGAGSAVAASSLGGSAELNWAQYQVRVDGADSRETSHFLQRYSVLYQSQNKISNGRAGSWDVALGYEWASLSNSDDGQDSDASSGKLLYSGNLLFAPGGLPFRLQAFAHDMDSQSTRVEGGRQGGLLQPAIYTDLMAGERFTAGFTLLAGIKNGSYLGQYREILSSLPKLLIDYRETTINDDEGLHKEHTRLRDLAFVSLNKKDNWFHYRVTEYEDFNRPASNFEERAYIIGTVDHLLRRQWINLTNWIKVAADGSLTQLQLAPGAGKASEDEYRLNLFTKATRAGWKLNNFTTLVRRVDTQGLLEKERKIPFYAEGQYDPDNKWRMSLVQSSRERSYSGVQDLKEDLLYGTYQLETQRSSGLLQATRAAFDVQRLTIGQNSQNGQDGQAARAEIELRTDPRRDLPYAWLADYSLAVFNASASGDNYVEQRLTLAADDRSRQRLRYGGELQLGLGLGTYVPGSFNTLAPFLASGFDGDPHSDNTVSGTAWRAQAETYLELSTASRWRHRLTGYYDHIQMDEARSRFRLSHALNYSTEVFSLASRSLFETGDDVTFLGIDGKEVSLAAFIGKADAVVTNETRLQYQPVRNWRTGGRLTASWADGDLGSGVSLLAEQTAAYSLYARGGLRRKLLDLEQKFSVERIWATSERPLPTDLWFVEFGVAAILYPTPFLNIHGWAEYRHFGVTERDEFDYGVEANMNFPMLVANVSYEYAQRESSGPLAPELTEQRWEVGVKKTF